MVKIIINNALCDGYNSNDIDIAISLGIQDAKEINKTFGAVTKTIKLPATPVNKIIFDFVEDANCEGLNQNTKVEGRIEQDGTLINSGYVKVISATPEQYEFTLRGGNKGIWNLISELYLNDIDWSDLDRYWTITNVMNTWGTDDIIIFPLIDYGWISAWASNQSRLLKVNDFYPAFKIKEILRRIIECAGYTIDSDFYDSDYFARKYMPFVGKFNHTEDYRTDRLFKAVYSADQTVYFLQASYGLKMIFDTEIFDTGSYYSTALGLYSAGIVKTSLVVKLGFKELWGSYSTTNLIELRLVKMLIGGATELLQVEQFDDVTIFETYVFETDYITLNSGESIFIELYTWDDLLTDYILDAEKCSLSNDVSLEYLEGQIINFNDIIFDLKQLDFIQMVKNLFNLHFDTDNINKIIYFEPENDFYNRGEFDLSKLIDNSVKPEISFVSEGIEKTLNLGYKEDSNDKFQAFVNEDLTVPLGTHQENMLNQFGENDEGYFDCGFSFTNMEYFGQLKIFSFKLPRMWTEDTLPSKKSADFNYRILHNAGMRDLTGGERVAIKITSGQVLYATSIPYFFSFNDSEINNLSLKFEDDEYSYGMVANYHKPIINKYNYGKFIKLRILIDSLLISRFETEQYFRNRFKIESAEYPEITGFYRLVKIKDYKPNIKGTTDILLMTIPDKIAFGLKDGDTTLSQTLGMPRTVAIGNTTGTRIQVETLGQKNSVKHSTGNDINGGILYEEIDGYYQPVLEVVNNKLINVTL